MEKLLKNSKEYLALPKDHKRDFLDQLYQFIILSNKYQYL